MQALLERARRKKEEEEAKKMDPDKQQQLQEKFAQIQLPETSLGPPEIDPSEITIEHVLGDGSFGTVYQGQCRSKKVAVKKLIKQNLDEKELQDFRREIEILSSIFSPNICLFMGACTTPGNLMIVTELMRSDLERLLQDEGVQLTLFTRVKMGKEIALGMNWLHQNKPPIIHRDLKPSNILVDENLNVKVSDFGLSQIKWTNAKLSAKGEPGSAYWMAPEVLLGKEYTEKCDVYSFGIVLWELLTRKEPFEEFDDWDTFLDAVCNQNQRPAIPNGTNPGLKTLIEDCWAADDSARPPFSTIVKRLDTILIDIAVMDLQANTFWKKYFPTRDQVPWKDFINELGRFLKLTACVNFSSAQRWVSTAPVSELIENHMDLLEGTNLSVNVRCLKSLVADKLKTSQGVILDSEEEVVGLEKFGNVMNWFGPMKIPNSPNEETVLDKIREVLACNWFHGDIPTKEAERMLMGEIPGRFFVRFSTTTPGGFTISKVGKKPTDSATSIRHQRISHSLIDDKYTVHPSNRSYNTLQDLIAAETSELQLLHPYPGSKYLSLFVEQDVSGYKEEPSQQPGDKADKGI